MVYTVPTNKCESFHTYQESPHPQEKKTTTTTTWMLYDASRPQAPNSFWAYCFQQSNMAMANPPFSSMVFPLKCKFIADFSSSHVWWHRKHIRTKSPWYHQCFMMRSYQILVFHVPSCSRSGRDLRCFLVQKWSSNSSPLALFLGHRKDVNVGKTMRILYKEHIVDIDLDWYVLEW